MAGRIRTGTRPAAQRYRLIRTRHCPDAILLANAARVAVAGGALPKREASRVANAEPPRYSVWCRNIRRQATRQYEKCGLGTMRVCLSGMQRTPLERDKDAAPANRGGPFKC